MNVEKIPANLCYTKLRHDCRYYCTGISWIFFDVRGQRLQVCYTPGKPFEKNDLLDASKDNDSKIDETKSGKELSKNNKKSKKAQNHGHRPSADYSEAKVIDIAHHTLKKGDVCPDCLKGKVFRLKPGTVIRITGQPWLQIEIYRPERFRCALCGKTFTAILPKDVAMDSSSGRSVKAIVNLLKYRGGVPFYRQGQM